MIVVTTHEIISFEQSRCLERFMNFITKKRNKTKNEFEKDFYKLLTKAFYRKTMENVQSRLRLEFIKKYEYEKNNETTI